MNETCWRCHGTRLVIVSHLSQEAEPCPVCSAGDWRNFVMKPGLLYRKGDYEGTVEPLREIHDNGDGTYANRRWEAFYSGVKIGEGYALASFRAMEAVMRCVSEHRHRQD
jgi:hypothetical protein